MRIGEVVRVKLLGRGFPARVLRVRRVRGAPRVTVEMLGEGPGYVEADVHESRIARAVAVES